jgi:hypothetical protein
MMRQIGKEVKDNIVCQLSFNIAICNIQSLRKITIQDRQYSRSVG